MKNRFSEADKKYAIIFLIPLLSLVILAGAILNELARTSVRIPQVIEDNVQILVEGLYADSLKLEDATHFSLLLDKQYGVALGMYKDGKLIYPIDSEEDPDDPPKPEFLNGFNPNLVGEGPVHYYYENLNILGKNYKHGFYSMRRGDYVILWGVRPDFYQRYFIDFDSFMVPIFSWLLAMVLISLISLIIFLKKNGV